MPEETGNPPQAPETNQPQTPIPFDISQEFSTARSKLPPAKIVAIVVGVLAVILGIVAFVQKPRQSATGSIDAIDTVQLPQGQMMVAMTLSIHNGSNTAFVIHDVKAGLEANNNTYTDDAASAVDLDRYFQAFPELKAHAVDPVHLESRIEPGGDLKGTIIVSFPVTYDVFKSRKSLTVTIWPAEQLVPLVLTRKD